MTLIDDIMKKFPSTDNGGEEDAVRLKICNQIAAEAEELFKKGPNDYPMAARCQCSCLKVDPEYIPAWYKQGAILESGNEDIQDLRSAQHCYEQVITLTKGQNHEEVYFKLAEILDDQNFKFFNLDKAIESYTKHLEFSPNDTDAMYNIAMIHGNKDYKKRDFAKAKEWYLKCIAKDDKYLSAYNNLGLLFSNKSNPSLNYDQSKGYFDKAIEIDNNFGKAHNNLGVLYHTDEYEGYNLEKSLDCYETAIDVMHEYAIAHYNLANLLLMMETKKGGSDEKTEMSQKLVMKCLQNYLELVPDDDDAKKMMKETKDKMNGTLMESISYLEKYIKLQPMDTKSKETLDGLKKRIANEEHRTYKEVKAEYHFFLSTGAAKSEREYIRRSSLI